MSEASLKFTSRHLALQRQIARGPHILIYSRVTRAPCQPFHFLHEHTLPPFVPEQRHTRYLVVLGLAAQHDAPVVLHLSPARCLILARRTSVVREGQHLHTITLPSHNSKLGLSLRCIHVKYNQHPVERAEMLNLGQQNDASVRRQQLGEGCWQGLLSNKLHRAIVDNAGDSAGDSFAARTIVVTAYLVW